MTFTVQNRIDLILDKWSDLSGNLYVKLDWFRIIIASFIIFYTGYIICYGFDLLWHYSQNGILFKRTNIINGIYLIIFTDFLPSLVLKKHINNLLWMRDTRKTIDTLADIKLYRKLFNSIYLLLALIVIFGLGLRYGNSESYSLDQSFAIAFWIGLMMALIWYIAIIYLLHFSCKRVENLLLAMNELD